MITTWLAIFQAAGLVVMIISFISMLRSYRKIKATSAEMDQLFIKVAGLIEEMINEGGKKDGQDQDPVLAEDRQEGGSDHSDDHGGTGRREEGNL